MTTARPEPTATRRPRTSSPGWLVLDLVAIVVFAAIGRHSHDEGVDVLGILRTAAPFLAGAVIGWVTTRAWRMPLCVRTTGLGVWGATLVLGMILRVITGGGIEVSFVIVAGVFLALFLLGWRVVVSRLVR